MTSDGYDAVPLHGAPRPTHAVLSGVARTFRECTQDPPAARTGLNLRRHPYIALVPGLPLKAVFHVLGSSARVQAPRDVQEVIPGTRCPGKTFQRFVQSLPRVDINRIAYKNCDRMRAGEIKEEIFQSDSAAHAEISTKKSQASAYSTYGRERFGLPSVLTTNKSGCIVCCLPRIPSFRFPLSHDARREQESAGVMRSLDLRPRRKVERTV